MVGLFARDRLESGCQWCLCLATALAFTACGLDETYTSMGQGALPGDPLKPIPVHAIVDIQLDIQCMGPGQQDVEPESTPMNVENLEGYAWRFSELKLTKPLKGVLGDSVNKFFTDDIAANKFNVLLRAETDDRDARTLHFVVGPGTAGATDGEYGFEGTPSELGCLLYGGRFETESPSFLAFATPAGVLDPPELPIRDLELSGVISPDGETIESGILVGVMTLEDAKKIKALGMPFDAVLEDSGVMPDLDLNTDGTMDAYGFKGTFAATKVTVK